MTSLLRAAVHILRSLSRAGIAGRPPRLRVLFRVLQELEQLKASPMYIIPLLVRLAKMDSAVQKVRLPYVVSLPACCVVVA